MSDAAGRAGDTAVLVPDGERPLPARADAWSLPGPRRKARREFRPRRRIPGVLVAGVLVAAGIVGCIWAASAALGHPLWNIPHSDFAGPAGCVAHRSLPRSKRATSMSTWRTSMPVRAATRSMTCRRTSRVRLRTGAG